MLPRLNGRGYDRRMRFKVIDGTPPPEQDPVRKRLRASKPAELLQCHRCGGREVIETRVGVTFRAGKATGGTRIRLCAHCFMNGERVVLT